MAAKRRTGRDEIEARRSERERAVLKSFVEQGAQHATFFRNTPHGQAQIDVHRHYDNATGSDVITARAMTTGGGRALEGHSRPVSPKWDTRLRDVYARGPAYAALRAGTQLAIEEALSDLDRRAASGRDPARKPPRQRRLTAEDLRILRRAEILRVELNDTLDGEVRGMPVAGGRHAPRSPGERLVAEGLLEKVGEYETGPTILVVITPDGRAALRARDPGRDRESRTRPSRDRTTTKTKTPGYNSHLSIAFSADKRGKPLAYYWSGHGYPGAPFGGRWIRMPLENARMFVAQELATQVPYLSGNGTGNDRDATREPSRSRKPVRVCPVGTRVQSLILSRVFFDRIGAFNWAAEHDFRSGKVDTTENSYRFRQEDPSRFVEGDFRTITLAPGVKAVIGCPR